MKISDDLEKLLPFGYLFLILMGILKDSIYYYQFGINILRYSTIMDVLISPIAEFTSNPIILATIILMFIAHFYLPAYLAKNKDKAFIKKTFELKSTDELSAEETKSYYNGIAIKSLAIILLSFFLGYGLAGGYFGKEKLKNNKLEYSYQLDFNEGESKNVSLIGNNSLYYFYFVKGDKTIKITPLSSIKNIQLIQNKMIN
ncbi:MULTISPECIES: hypothetical protein [unclassified Flavobacterium]|uniref:hypothetical protein n=1 Tax=unclassified Flavobacterium TaxID=196869 RepID=UPI00070C5F13|nr:MULTISPECIES: hypothetical protein [unclassified Flavobacterium]KRD57604.1 hypothetical protein ASE40_14650 [Flavobacterium sp. Root935]BDU26519.1 hypothetical protein FLGSB24_32630 [Flavobacterium sp. GSB-24]